MDSLARLRSQVPTDPFYHMPVDIVSHSKRPELNWSYNANADWCESNYVHSDHIAEWYNFLSSIPMILCGFFGVWMCARYRLEPRFWTCYTALLIIGVGSCLFHGTLTWWGQALDELPMIYGSTAYFYTVVEAEYAHTRRPWLLYAEALYSVTFTIAYFTSPAFFPVFIAMYATAVCLILYQAARIHGAHFKSDDSAGGRWQRRLFWVAAILYPFAFLLLWVPENALCPYYPALFRRLQLHAWFHILTTISPFCFVVYMTYFRYTIVLKRANVQHRLCGYVLPYVHIQ